MSNILIDICSEQLNYIQIIYNYSFMYIILNIIRFSNIMMLSAA